MAANTSRRSSRSRAASRMTPRRPPHAEVGLRVDLGPRALRRIHHLDPAQVEPEPADRLPHLVLAAEQDRSGDPLVEQDARGAKNGLVGALGKDHPRVFLAGFQDQPAQGLPSGSQADGEALLVGGVGQGVARHPFLHRLAGHRRRFPHQDPGIDGLGEKVFRSEDEVRVAVGPLHLLHHVLPGQFGQGARGREQHALGDTGGPGVQCPAEDVGKAQQVHHRVRVLAEAGGHDHVLPARARRFVPDLRLRGGQGEDHRIAAHGADHLGGQDSGGRGSEEHVGASKSFRQGARGVVAGVETLEVVEIGARRMHEAVEVVDQEVLRPHPQAQEKPHAAGPHGARPAHHNPDLPDPFLHQVESVQQRRPRHHRRAVEVLVENRDVEGLAQPVEEDEALGGADVLQVHPAEGGLQRLHHLHEVIGVLHREFEIENVDVSQALEQHRHPLEHGLGRLGADVAEAGDGGSIGDHPHQIPARGVAEYLGRGLGDLRRRECRAGEVSQPHLARGEAGLGPPHLDLSGAPGSVIGEGILASDHGVVSLRAAAVEPRGRRSRVSLRAERKVATGRTWRIQVRLPSTANSRSRG